MSDMALFAKSKFKLSRSSWKKSFKRSFRRGKEIHTHAHIYILDDESFPLVLFPRYEFLGVTHRVNRFRVICNLKLHCKCNVRTSITFCNTYIGYLQTNCLFLKLGTSNSNKNSCNLDFYFFI